MGKNKADYQKEAAELGVEFTEETTVKELQAAIKEAGKKLKAKRVVDEQAETLKAREERRARDREEKALAAKNRAAATAAAAALVRSGPQKAVDRLKESQ